MSLVTDPPGAARPRPLHPLEPLESREETRDEGFYRRMLLIRRFEERVFELHRRGAVRGTSHTCIGQEANCIGVIDHLRDGDHIFSNHRCHGHYLARTGDSHGLLAEIMGHPDGACRGVGGSQHVSGPGFKSNGILGGTVPAAAGIAMAERLNDTDNVSAVFIGDGTLGQGVVYETLNIAARWKLPLLIILEDNGWAQSTPVTCSLAGHMAARFTAFDIPVVELESTDVLEIHRNAGEVVRAIRQDRAPRALILHTYRLCPHALGEDHRPVDQVRARWSMEPLRIHGARVSPERRALIRSQVEAALDHDMLRIEVLPAAIPPKPAAGPAPKPREATRPDSPMIFARALGAALRRLLEVDSRVLLLGEDIADPYGGAFKVTRGLSTDFPDRVIPTPVSEQGLAGLSAGLAMSGYRPMLEIMFGDFLTLCFDQIVNHIAKYRAMYADQVSCPVVIRSPSGGGRGYGATHSQSLEKHFLGIPDFQVVAASLFHDPFQILRNMLSQADSTLYVEHKLLYPERMTRPGDPGSGDLIIDVHRGEHGFPTLLISAVPREQCTVTVLAYGYQATRVAEVLECLAVEEEIFAVLVLPSRISPVDWRPIEESVRTTRRLITVEEGVGGWSWGTEIATHISETHFGRLRKPVKVLTSERAIIPAARDLEAKVLVDRTRIEAAIREAVR